MRESSQSNDRGLSQFICRWGMCKKYVNGCGNYTKNRQFLIPCRKLTKEFIIINYEMKD